MASGIVIATVFALGIMLGNGAALFGFYRAFAVGFAVLVLASGAWAVVTASRQALRHRNAASIVGIVGILALSGTTWFFHHESIDTHTDPGAYWSSAMFLAKTGSILTSDPSLSRLPTFDYSPTHDITAPQALPGYAIVLGSAVPLIGYPGTALMNSLIFATFLVCVAGFMGALQAPRWAFPTFVVIYGTLYTTTWFSRRYGNEAISGVLLLGAGIAFSLAARKRAPALALAAPAIGLPVILVRPEGPLYAVLLVGTGLILTAWLRWHGASFGRRSNAPLAGLGSMLVVAAACIVLFALFLSASGSRVYEENFVQPLSHLFGQDGAAGGDSVGTPVVDQTDGWPGYERHQLRLVFDSNVRYGLVVYYLAALAAVAWRTVPPAAFWGLVSLAPAAFVFVAPGITPDQPWMMRRFWLLPVAVPVLLGSIWLARIGLAHRKAAAAVIVLLMAGNAVIAHPVYTYVQGDGAFDAIDDMLAPFDGQYLLFSDALTNPPIYTKFRDWLPAMALCCGAHVFASQAGRGNPEGVFRDYENFTSWLPGNATWHVVGRLEPVPGEPYHPFFGTADLTPVGRIGFNHSDLAHDADLFPYVLAGGNFSSYQPIAERMARTPPTNVIVQAFAARVYDSPGGLTSGFVAAYESNFRSGGVRLHGVAGGWAYDAGRFRISTGDAEKSLIQVVGPNVTRLTLTYVDERIETCEIRALGPSGWTSLARIPTAGSQQTRTATVTLLQEARTIQACRGLLLVSAVAD